MRRSAHDTMAPSALPRDPVLAGLTLDSRKARPGYLFAALPGTHQDGAAFVADAVGRGAAAILAAPDASLPALDRGLAIKDRAISIVLVPARAAISADASIGAQPP